MKSHRISLTEPKEFLSKLNTTHLKHPSNDLSRLNPPFIRPSKLNSPKLVPNDENFELNHYFKDKSSPFYIKFKNKIDKYKSKIVSLEEENKKLQNINQMLIISIARKDEFILNIIKESDACSHDYNKIYHKLEILNKNRHEIPIVIRKDKNLVNKYSKSVSFIEVNSQNNLKFVKGKKIKERLHDHDIKDKIDPHSNRKDTLSSIEKLFDQIPKQKTVINEKLRVDIKATPVSLSKNKRISESFTSLPKKSGEVQLPSYQVTDYYQHLSDLVLRNTNKKKFGKEHSFLAMKEDFIHNLIRSELFRDLFPATNNEHEFPGIIKQKSDDKLMIYGYQINSFLKDYVNALKLIMRIKNFFKISLRLNESLCLDDATKMLVENTCTILDCERCSIFVLEKSTNMLVVYSGEGLSKSELRVPSDKGIVGHVFTKGERLKIDDAYLDERFNKEIDVKTHFYTKNILCVPLKNKNGEIFGAIQSINKKDSAFTSDDEEILEIFANQAASILSNSIHYDENVSLISRLKMMVNLAISIQEKELKQENFSPILESFFLKCWSLSAANFFYYNHEENTLIRKTKYENKSYPIIGLIGYVIKTKEYFGANKSEDCSHYNSLIDIETGFTILTFPVLDRTSEKVLGVLQTEYPFKLNSLNKKPKEDDWCLINLFCELVSPYLESLIK